MDTPELSQAQREHWEKRLVDAERAVTVAKRVLGIIAVEETVEINEKSLDTE